MHRALYQTWQEHPDALDALARFAGAAPAAMRVVLRYPELADVVADEEQLTRRRTPSELRDELAERLAHASTYDRRLTVLRRFKLREFVRLAARRILAPTPVDVETCEWSELAEVLVREALDTALERLRCEGRWPRADAAEFTVFSLGRFSGHELHFASDLDLLYVRGADAEITQQQYELLGRSLTEALQTVTEEGRLFEADLRLRPEGRQGFTVATLEGARRYYGDGGRAETWELQMLTRLRPIAGNAAVAEAFRALIEPRVYRAPMPATWREEIRAMKRRIETERVSERERPWNLKLGAGGFSDIEFLVQYLQLEGGGADPSLRQTSTVGVIRALEAAGRLSAEAAAVLLAAHGFLTGLRQALYLLGPNGGDCLPLGETDSRLNVALARALGYGDPEELQRAYQAHTGPVRELFLEELGGAST